MKRRELFRYGVLGLLAAGACGDAELTDEPAPETPSYGAQSLRGVVPGRYLVTLRPGLPAAQRVSVSASAIQAMGGTLHHQYAHALQGFAASLPDEAVGKLRADPAVLRVEPDRYVSASGSQSNPPWGLDRIDQTSLPLNRTYTYGRTGKGVDVYVVDTGVRVTHRELTGRARSGFSAIMDGRGTDDCNGHGTHVAGTIGGNTYGVAKEADIYAVRVLNCQGSGTDAQVIAGIDWVAEHHQAGRPAVANMSLGGEATETLDDAVKAAVADGVTFVVAAGNESQDACNVSPARTPEAVTVGATNSWDWRALYSNFGRCVDIFAPGSGVLSSYGSGDSATATLSGTSMASPHVAGAAALYLEANPTATPAAGATGLAQKATLGKIVFPGGGSPNRLLSINF